MLHPVTPFITEELWQHLKNDGEGMIISEAWPEYRRDHVFEEDVRDMDHFMEIVTAIRNLRNSVNVKPKEEVEIRLFTDDESLARHFYKSRGYFKELAKVKAGRIKDKSVERPTKSVMKATPHTEVFMPLEGVIDIEEYKGKLSRDLTKARSEFEKVEKKLKNPKFMENAPDDVVAEVKEKFAGFEEQVNSIESSLQSLE